MVVMRSRAYFAPRIGHIRRGAAVLSGVVAAAALCGGIGTVPTAEASASGWYVATVPGTGLDDVLLGSTCANALQCWAVGVTFGTSVAASVDRQPTR